MTGRSAACGYLATVRDHAPAESNSALQQSASANAAYTVANYVPDAQRSAARREWLDAAWSALWAAAPGSGAQLTWARAVAAAACYDDSRAAEIRAMLDGGAPDGLRLDPDLRWLLWTALSATGHASVADLDAELTADATASGRTAWLRAMAARPLADVKEAAWSSVIEDESLTNDHLDATIAGFRAGERRDLIAGYDEAYFAAILGVWEQRSIEIARRIVVGLFPAADSLESVDGWLAAHRDAPAALRRLVVEQRDQLARAVRVREWNAGAR